jgi:hypothetical protein
MRADLHAAYGLPFLPVDDVRLGWNLLKPSLTQYPATAAFISYFESNWLNNPHYPLKMWDCYDATLSDDPKTNNVSEGSNNAINTAAGCSSPTIYRFIDIIQGFNSEAELKILQTATGQEASRKPRNKTIKMKERVRRTVEGYRSENIVAYCRSHSL